MTSQDRAKVFTVNIQDGATRNVIAFLELQSSLITCVQLNLAMITVHLNYAKRLFDIWTFFPCRTDELDALNKLNERTIVWWDN